MTETTTKQEFKRFGPGQRFEHIVLLVTFTGLALTGLPQKYAAEAWAKTMIDLMGGVESVRIVHRILATILMAESIYHGGIISYKLYVLGRRATMIPGLRDIRDVIQWIGFNLGIVREHHHLPKYNFGEKVEYLAVVWGTIVMVITGFMLWNPIATASIFPGEVIPAARLAHGAEALLAVLSILIWHMYNVHIRRFNRSMFTGKLSREAMEEEHGEELAAIERGEQIPTPPAEVVARRKRRFWPYAVAMTILLVGGLIFFVTFEQSAITTIPRPRSIEGQVLTISAEAGNVEEGETLWAALPCQGCHGDLAQGGVGSLNVALAGTTLSIEQFAANIRRGPADMPAFPPEQVNEQQIADLYVWLRTLPTIR